MKKILALFKSTHDVIKAEKICLASNIKCRIIPKPRYISTDCGMVIEIGKAEGDKLQKLCSDNSLSVKLHEIK